MVHLFLYRIVSPQRNGLGRIRCRSCLCLDGPPTLMSPPTMPLPIPSYSWLSQGYHRSLLSKKCRKKTKWLEGKILGSEFWRESWDSIPGNTDSSVRSIHKSFSDPSITPPSTPHIPIPFLRHACTQNISNGLLRATNKTRCCFGCCSCPNSI